MASESILDYRLRERGAGPPTSGAWTESPQLRRARAAGTTKARTARDGHEYRSRAGIDTLPFRLRLHQRLEPFTHHRSNPGRTTRRRPASARRDTQRGRHRPIAEAREPGARPICRGERATSCPMVSRSSGRADLPASHSTARLPGSQCSAHYGLGCATSAGGLSCCRRPMR